MATPGFNTSPFVLPNMFDKPGDALQQSLARKERQEERRYELDYRNQKDKEADDWRKLGMIREFTDIDKYHTGVDVADALGEQKMAEVLQKYTAMSGNMSPAELQSKLSLETAKTISSMSAMKDELSLSDEKIKQYKKMFPSLNDAQLTKIIREEVIGRRVRGGEFANPIDANQPSGINLDDPDFLSDFIDVNKGLKEAVVNPKNIQKDVTVLRGSPSSYVSYQGDLPYYMQDDFQTAGGFYNQKGEPTTSLKTSAIPQGSFSGADQQIDVLDKGAFDILKNESSEVEMALRKLAKAKYSDYSSMSNADKEIAMRDVAKDFITPFSNNYKYRPKTATKPPRNTTNNYIGSGGSNINNVYKRIDEKINANFLKGFNGTRFNSLSNDEQQVIKTAVENAGYAVDRGGANIYLTKDGSGTIKIYRIGDDGSMKLTPDNEIASLSFQGTNRPVQPGVGEKRTLVEMGEQKTPTPKQNTKTETVAERMRRLANQK